MYYYQRIRDLREDRDKNQATIAKLLDRQNQRAEEPQLITKLRAGAR